MIFLRGKDQTIAIQASGTGVLPEKRGSMEQTGIVRPKAVGTLESALYADDLTAAADFWERIIGLEKIAAVPDRHVFFRVGSGVLLVFRPQATAVPPEPDARLPVPPHGAQGPGHYCLAVRPEDLDGWRDWLQQNGIAIEADFIWPSGGRSVYVRDPAGNSIELADPRLWSN